MLTLTVSLNAAPNIYTQLCLQGFHLKEMGLYIHIADALTWT